MAGFCHIVFLLALIFDGSQAANVKLLENIAAKFQFTNTALGTFSRSKIVNAVSRQMRGENAESVQEGLNQAIVTLAVLDVGGGALVPLADKLIDTVTTDRAFTNVANAMKQYGDPMVSKLDDLRNLDDQGLKDLLKAKKIKAIRLFDANVNRLSTTHGALKHIKKAQRWLKVKSAGKVLGPLFDMISIGVNGWALGTAIRDCVADAEACNPASMTAASLSIASGLVGVGTFIACLMVGASVASVVGPVGAIVGLALAITATLIELFWKPGPTQAQLDRLMKEGLMRELDRISRLQLYNANKFLTENDVERSDLYVINQGHLPKWFSQHSNAVKFGKIAANKPRKKRPLIQSCSKPIFGNALGHPNGYGNKRFCPYLVDGEELRTTRTSRPLGYGFYGFTKSARTYFKQGPSTIERNNPPDPPYGGTMLLVGTDQVQPSKLAKYKNMQANLRGLDIDTGAKNGAAGNFDDLIAIADMHTLDRGETIEVRMGSGNDALNIDGRLGSFSASNVLNADLGTTGHNTLSFDAIAVDSPIKGVEYNAKDGVLHFKHDTNQKQRVGVVRNVEIFAASPFNDDIKMYAGKPGEGGFDFTVFKFKGKGTYEINIVDLASQSEVRHFKIVDSTDNRRDANDCADHVPLLKLINFDASAVANDVLYKNDRIKVYGKRASKKRSYLNKFSAPATANKSDKRTARCSGEPTDGSHPEGGKNGKVLLATIAFYSKCPIEIQTTNVGGSCMMTPKKKTELDLAFFQGKKLFSDFSTNVGATNGADHCYLKCPSGTVTTETWINLSDGSRDKVIISSELFLDPCGIDGETVKVTMQRYRVNNWLFVVEGNEDKFGANGKIHGFHGVEQIINEYGDLVIDMKNAKQNRFDLYAEYSRATMQRIASIAGHERTPEVKNSLLQCMKEESEMSAEEKEICLDISSD